MIGAPHDFPGVAVVVDIAPPGQRLEADTQAPPGGALSELAQIVGGAVDAAKRVRRNVAADEQEIGAELFHQLELLLRPAERLGTLRFRQSFEIAERLQ